MKKMIKWFKNLFKLPKTRLQEFSNFLIFDCCRGDMEIFKESVKETIFITGRGDFVDTKIFVKIAKAKALDKYGAMGDMV